MSYNLASGGEGGDLSKYINYSTRQLPNNNCSRANEWYQSMSDKQKKEWHQKQGIARSKGWYVSTVNNPMEIYVQNISKWCEENGVDKSMPSSLNNPKSHLFQKQTKGWRIRRSDMPELPPYENKRGKIVVDNNCAGKTWKLVNGKRVWCDK